MANRTRTDQDFETDLRLKTLTIEFLDDLVCCPTLLPAEHKAASQLLRLLTKEEPANPRVDLNTLLAPPTVSNLFPCPAIPGYHSIISMASLTPSDPAVGYESGSPLELLACLLKLPDLPFLTLFFFFWGGALSPLSFLLKGGFTILKNSHKGRSQRQKYLLLTVPFEYLSTPSLFQGKRFQFCNKKK